MDKRSKQYTETKKVSRVEKEKKSETSDQRLWRNTRLLYNVGKTALVAGVLLSEKMIGMAYAENSNQAKEVVDSTRRSLYQNQTEGYVPRVEVRPEAVSLPESQTVDKIWPGLGKLIDEHETAFKNSLQREAQGRSDGTSSEQREVRRGLPLKKKVKIAHFSGETHSRKETPEREIPQSTMETQQGEQKGEKLQKKGTFLQMERAKRLFEARRLLQSTPPPSDNSTNPLASPLTCLSEVHESTASYKLSDNGAILGKITTIFPQSYVRNDCPGDVVDVKFQLTAIPECRGRPTNNQQWTFDASPSVLVPGETATGGASDSKGFTFQCVRWSNIGPVDTSFPTSLWAEIKASGKLVEVKQRRPVEGKTFFKRKLI
jgi:hypothetical protein